MSWCARLAALIVLLIAGDTQASAQQVCYAITPRESASQIASRLTGDARNRDAAWFQIVDQRWRVVSKSRYGSIQPGWLACVDHGLRAAVIRDRSTGSSSWGVDFTVVLVGAAVFAGLYFIRFVSRYARDRRERRRTLRRFGLAFVREFGRPWHEFRGSGPAPRARLRVRPGRSHVEVLLAPTGGTSYPNLADHRGNVEYDVARVIAALGRESFVSRRPYAEGQWVVLPFEFMGSAKQESVR